MRKRQSKSIRGILYFLWYSPRAVLHWKLFSKVEKPQDSDLSVSSHLYRLMKVDKLIKAPVPGLEERLFRIKKLIEMDNHVEVLR